MQNSIESWFSSFIPLPKQMKNIHSTECEMMWSQSELKCVYSSTALKQSWSHYSVEWQKNTAITLNEPCQKESINDFEWICLSPSEPDISSLIEQLRDLWEQNVLEYGKSLMDHKLILNEGYLIAFLEKKCVILAKTAHGCFNGLQFLLQFLNFVSLEQIPSVQSSFIIFDYPAMQYRGFHLDLKKLTPTFDYVKKLIPFLARYRINYLLIEYEDKFPYTGLLASIPHEYAWTQTNLEEIKALCTAHFIEITPLIQVFGHVETFVLKEDFRKLQERPDGIPTDSSPMEVRSLCPLHPDTDAFISEMVNQQVLAHPHSEFIHIGADEVYQLGTCPKCKKFVKEHSNSELYIMHINKVAKHVIDAGKRPIMWHDYLLKYPEAIAQLDPRIVIMYWIYNNTEKVNPLVPPPDPTKVLPYFEYFIQLGHDVIGAPSSSSDFDGFLPNYATRLDNIVRHCTRAREANALGVLVTSWVVCLNPLETQLPLIMISGIEMWSPSNTTSISSDLWKRWDIGLQRDLWQISEEKHIDGFENFALATERGRQRWPKRDAVARLPKAHESMMQIRSMALDHIQIVDSLLLGLEWHDMHGLILRIFEDHYLPYVEADAGAHLPPIDEMQDHAKIFKEIGEKQSQFFQKAIRYYCDTTHQIYPREFDLVMGMPRYNTLGELEGLGRDLHDVTEALDRFILGFLRMNISL